MVDAVFHPPVTHIKRFRKFLAHFGIEDTVGCAIVGFDGRSGFGLRVAHFFERGDHWTGVFGAQVSACGFSFGCRGDDIFDGAAEDIDWAIDIVIVFPANKVAVDGCAASGFRKNWTGGVCRSFEWRIAGVETDDGVGMRARAIHWHVSFFDGV